MGFSISRRFWMRICELRLLFSRNVHLCHIGFLFDTLFGLGHVFFLMKAVSFRKVDGQKALGEFNPTKLLTQDLSKRWTMMISTYWWNFALRVSITSFQS